MLFSNGPWIKIAAIYRSIKKQKRFTVPCYLSNAAVQISGHNWPNFGGTLIQLVFGLEIKYFYNIWLVIEHFSRKS